MSPAYYNGKNFLVFHAHSHPYTYVYVFGHMGDSGTYRKVFSYRRNG